MAFERRARGLQLLHGRREHKGGDKRRREGVSHRFVVLGKRELENIQPQTPIEIEEKQAPHVIAFGDDDGILLTQVVQACKGRAEHGMRRNITAATLRVVGFEIRFHRGNVGENAVFGEKLLHLAESLKRIFERYGIDHQFRGKFLYFWVFSEAQGVIDEAQLLRIGFKNGHFVVETQEVDEKTPHTTCTED